MTDVSHTPSSDKQSRNRAELRGRLTTVANDNPPSPNTAVISGLNTAVKVSLDDENRFSVNVTNDAFVFTTERPK